jgi:pyridoxamine 5'-phosphate oxidase
MSSLSNPPWKKLVKDILQKNLDDGRTDSLFFTLATIRHAQQPRPAVRTVGFRGFVGEDNGKGKSRNPGAESSLILVSTDISMSKVRELERSNGVYEVCWWHAGTNQQIRFSGTAHIFRRNQVVEFPEAWLKRYISVKGDKEWTWTNERDRLWRVHTPRLRGTFRNPPSGTPLDCEGKRARLHDVQLAPDDDREEAKEAKERFALLVLEITELEIMDLDPPPVHVP